MSDGQDPGSTFPPTLKDALAGLRAWEEVAKKNESMAAYADKISRMASVPAPVSIVSMRVPPNPTPALLGALIDAQHKAMAVQQDMLNAQRAELQHLIDRSERDGRDIVIDRRIALWVLIFAVVAAGTGVVALIRM